MENHPGTQQPTSPRPIPGKALGKAHFVDDFPKDPEAAGWKKEY